MTTIIERVERGARLLDLMRPGWAREIALDRLAMESCDECILGQLYGDYLSGLEVLESKFGDEFYELKRPGPKHGFTLFREEQNWEQEVVGVDQVREWFVPLTRAWRAEIRKRLESEVSA